MVGSGENKWSVKPEASLEQGPTQGRAKRGHDSNKGHG